jgi:pimeloyl-ACP methyl ester carboxylesterase
VTEHTVDAGAPAPTFYLAAGPEDGPLVIFVHGWPELSISWRHQLPALGALGFRAVAPDMRGYGRSYIPSRAEEVAHEHTTADLIGLLDALRGGAARAWSSVLSLCTTVHPQLHTDSRIYSVPLFLKRSCERTLGSARAVFVGHDWGSPIVWSLAAHHPQRVAALASLCVGCSSQGWAVEPFRRRLVCFVYVENR